MFWRIESIGGNPRALMVLLVLFGVLVVTVVVQVTRFAGTADAGSERPATKTPAGAKPPPTPGVHYTISGTISAPLRPGGAPIPIDVGFASTNEGNGGTGVNGVRVSRLVVTITGVTGPSISASRICTEADFVLTQFDGSYPFYVPGGASSLSTLGFASGTWPTLRMRESGSNQNGCKSATVGLTYTGTP